MRSIRPVLNCFFTAGILMLFSSCGTLSSRIVYDSVEAVGRLSQKEDPVREIDELVLPLIKSGESSGMVVALLIPDEKKSEMVVYNAAAESRREGEMQKLTGNSLFQVGSVSKLFLTSLFAVLVDEGALDPEETVREIMPADIEITESIGSLTLYELMTNTGGLPREPKGFNRLKYFIRYLFTGKNLYGYINREYLYHHLKYGKIKPKDRGSYHYSNISYAFLAHLMEVKLGKSMPELLEEKIFIPLKMSNTTFFPDETQREMVATGHAGSQEPFFMKKGSVIEPWDMGDLMRPVGGAYSTPHDLALFLGAHMKPLDHPLEKSLQKTHRIEFETSVEDIAWGWLVNYYDEKSITIYYKHGMVAGYSVYIGFNPNENVGAVVMYSDFEWDDKVGHNLILRFSRYLKRKSQAES